MGRQIGTGGFPAIEDTSSDAEVQERFRGEDAVKAAEKAIQRILLDLEEEVGELDEVRVDTRPFANLVVEIFVLDAALIKARSES